MSTIEKENKQLPSNKKDRLQSPSTEASNELQLQSIPEQQKPKMKPTNEVDSQRYSLLKFKVKTGGPVHKGKNQKLSRNNKVNGKLPSQEKKKKYSFTSSENNGNVRNLKTLNQLTKNHYQIIMTTCKNRYQKLAVNIRILNLSNILMRTSSTVRIQYKDTDNIRYWRRPNSTAVHYG